MFTTGRILFTLFFILLFVGALVWGYRKDLQKTGVHYKKTYLVLVGLLTFIGVLYLIVKLRKFL